MVLAVSQSSPSIQGNGFRFVIYVGNRACGLWEVDAALS